MTEARLATGRLRHLADVSMLSDTSTHAIPKRTSIVTHGSCPLCPCVMGTGSDFSENSQDTGIRSKARLGLRRTRALSLLAAWLSFSLMPPLCALRAVQAVQAEG